MLEAPLPVSAPLPKQSRWHRPHGYKEVLLISLPMIASLSSTTLMHFTDRVFLGHYSEATLAAALPSGITAFTCMTFFLGVAGYANTFVAQYMGADRPARVGATVWQAIYVSLFAGLFLIGSSFLAEPIFAWAGHEGLTQEAEILNFKVLLYGGVFAVLNAALSCFYSGRGDTRTVMLVNFAGVALNIPLNYILIFGKFGCPEMGIIGSAIATNAASATSCIIFLFLFLHPKNEAQFHTRSDWRFDAALFRRILRFGAPAGLQFFIDVFAFSFFALLIGRMGIVELAATNIVFSVIMLTFLPMIGFHIAISILTGQALGRHAPQEAKEVTTSALHMTFVYMLFIVAFFLLGAKPLLALFKPDHQSLEQFEPILNMGVILLRFVAFYSLFDTLNLVYSGTLKGAGDTFFVSMTILALSLFVMVIPVYWVVDAGGGIYLAWGFATAYACLLAVAFWWRYRQGHWETMSVIEPAPDDLLQEG